MSDAELGRKVGGDFKQGVFVTNARDNFLPAPATIADYTHHTPMVHSKGLSLLRAITADVDIPLDKLWYATTLQTTDAISMAGGSAFITIMTTPFTMRVLALMEVVDTDRRLLLPVRSPNLFPETVLRGARQLQHCT